MATRLKETDLPEAWSSSRKSSGSMSKSKEDFIGTAGDENWNPNCAVEERPKRGRGRPKSTSKAPLPSTKKQGKKHVSAANADAVLLRLEKAVPDVEDLRKKREEDALACGRRVRSVNDPPMTETDPADVPLVGTTRKTVDRVMLRNRGQGTASAMVSSGLQSITDKAHEVAKAVRKPQELPIDGHQQLPGRRLGKEPMNKESMDSLHVHRTMEEIDKCQMERGQTENFGRSQHAGGTYSSSKQRRSPPRSMRDLQPELEGMQSRHRVSPSAGRSSRLRVHYDSALESPDWNRNIPNPMCGQSSSRYRQSRSPESWTDREHHQSHGTLMKCDKGKSPASQCHDEYWFQKTLSNKDRQCDARYNEESPDHYPKQRRYESSRRRRSISSSPRRMRSSSRSPHERRRRRRSMSPSFSRSPPRRGSGYAREEDKAGTSGAIGRRERRHQQRSREDEVERRERFGNKSFKLEVDKDGIPFGRGKKAWLAEVTKLSVGLDPSCTHIRRQSYEDVQTFKDRLNDSFEYIGTPNDDHLRAVMGRAVTKKRSALIDSIRAGGEQPMHISDDVWHRLQQLAYSKETEERSEQGQYANSCRKTISRAGASGISGIREKLRCVWGRSPDPDDIREEMQRVKGPVLSKKRKPTISSKRETRDVIALSEDGSCSQFSGNDSEGVHSDSIYSQKYKRSNMGVMHYESQSNKNGEPKDYELENMPTDYWKMNARKPSLEECDDEDSLEDDSIMRLEAKLEKLKSRKSKASALTTGSEPHITSSIAYNRSNKRSHSDLRE